MFWLLISLLKGMCFFTGSYSNNVFPDPLTSEEEEKCISEMNNGSFVSTKFRPGTKYIKFLIWYNYNNTANTVTDIKNISIRELNN